MSSSKSKIMLSKAELSVQVLALRELRKDDLALKQNSDEESSLTCFSASLVSGACRISLC